VLWAQWSLYMFCVLLKRNKIEVKVKYCLERLISFLRGLRYVKANWKPNLSYWI